MSLSSISGCRLRNFRRWGQPLFLLMLAAISTTTARAVTYVKADAVGANDGSSWADAYTDLQDALADGGEIWVAAGTYYPTGGSDRNATFDLNHATSTIRLYGGFAGDETGRNDRNPDPTLNGTILSGDIGAPGDYADNSFHVLTCISTGNYRDVTVDGFTVTGGNADAGASVPSGGGLLVEDCGLYIVRTAFVGNRANFGGGAIYSNNGAYPRIYNSHFYANQSGSRGGAILNNAPGRVRLVNCAFVGNSSNAGGATYAFESNNEQPQFAGEFWIYYCTFISNRAVQDGGAISNFGGGQTRLMNSILYNNTAPSDPQYDPPLSDVSGGNIIGADPRIRYMPDPGDGDWATLEDNYYGDLRLRADSPAVEQDSIFGVLTDEADLDGDLNTSESTPLDLSGFSRFNGQKLDNGAYEFYEPILHVDAGATAGIGDGRTWDRAFRRLQDALAYAIDGDQIWVAEGTYTPGSSREDTFLVPAGVRVFGGFPSGGGERGFEARNYDPATNGTVLSGDLQGDDLAGFGNRSDNAYHVVTFLSSSWQARLDGFTIRGGHADGSGNNSRGGGILGGNTVYAGPVLSNLVIEDNFASGEGGGIYNGLYLRLVDSLVRDNRAATGGGIALANTFGELVNVILANNEGTVRGGAAYLINSSYELSNLTVYGNQSPQGAAMFGEISSSISLSNSIIWGNESSPAISGIDFSPTPSSNISQDDAGAPDPLVQLPGYGLAQDSPAIDAGDDSLRGRDLADTDLDGEHNELIPTDAYGHWRIAGDGVDIGAVEYQPPLSAIDYSVISESWEVGLEEGESNTFVPAGWINSSEEPVVWRPGPDAAWDYFEETVPLDYPAGGEHLLRIMGPETLVYNVSSATVEEGMIYELSVAIGLDLYVDSSEWSMELWADVDADGIIEPQGGTDIRLAQLHSASSGARSPAAGQWKTNHLSYVYDNSQHAEAHGKRVAVVLTSLSPELTAFFDQVRLDVRSKAALMAASPSAGSVEAGADQSIVLEFAEAPDPATISAASMTVTGSVSGVISGSIQVSGNRITFAPAALLYSGETITVSFAASASSINGISLDSLNFSFQTRMDPATDALARLNHYRPDSTIGNLVDTATGDFSYALNLLAVQGIRGLSLPVTHHSLFTAARGAVGHGWSHGYEVRLGGDPNNEVVVSWDTGRRNTFRFAGLNRPYVSSDPSMIYHKLVRRDDGSWLLTTPTRTHYQFGADGRLQRVGNSVFQWLYLHYDSGRLVRIEEPVAEKSLYLEYNERGLLSRVSDDIRRQVYLGYDDRDRLSWVTDPLLFGESRIGDPITSPRAIPDNGAAVAHLMPVGRIGAVGRLRIEKGLISVGASMTDLSLTLVAPSGRSVIVHNQTDRSRDFSGMVIDDFDGESIEGNWQLVMQDHSPGGSSSLLDWEMSYTGSSNTVFYHYPDGAFPQAGRLASATDLHGMPLFSNTYDSRGRVLTQDDGSDSNLPGEFTYLTHSAGLTTLYKDRLGNQFALDHNAAGHLTRIMDPLGAVTAFDLNHRGDRIRFTNPLGRAWSFLYDDFGNLTLVEDPLGREVPFKYDGNGNPVALHNSPQSTVMTYDGGNNITSVRHPSGHKKENEYDANSQLSSAADFRFDEEDESLTETTFIQWNGSIGKERTLTLPDGGTIVTTYDAIGQVISMTNADEQTTTTGFTQTGNVAVETDPLGNTRRFAYDYRDRLIEEIDKNGNRTTYAYDGNGNMVTRTHFLDSGTELVHRVLYDGEDRPYGSIDPAGYLKQQKLDPLGRVIEDIDREGRKFHIRYDLAGNEMERYDNDQRLVLKTGYNRIGLVEWEINARGFRTDYSYNDLWIPLEMSVHGKVQAGAFDTNRDQVPNEGPGGTRSIHSTYGVSRMANPAGVPTLFEFDSSGRVISSTTYSGSVNLRTEYAYNPAGLLSRTTFPSDAYQDFEYDDLGRLEKVRPSDSGTDGRLYAYDAKGNPVSTTRIDSSGNPLPNTTETSEFDALDRLVTYTDAEGSVIRFQYNPAGRLSLLVYPDNKTVAYDYNADGDLTTVTDWTGRITRYEYNAVGRVSRIDFPNGSWREMRYNNSGELSHRVDRGPDGALIVGYQYVRTLPSELAGEYPMHEEPPYRPQATTMSYDGFDRYKFFNGEQVIVDADGNTTKGPASMGLESMGYDAFNNLARVGDDSYHYDGADRLVGWTFGGDTTSLVVHPGGGLGQTLVKRNPDGTTTNYVYGIGLIYQETQGQTRTFHYDTRGSTVALSDDNGLAVGRISYGPYGEIASRSGDTDTIFLYNGLYGVITGPHNLYNMRFRWYSPGLKRFITADVHLGNIFVADSMNRFAFAGNNPIVRIDPDGELWFLAPLAGATVGAVVGTVSTLVVDYMEDGKINKSIHEYAGAAIGGAVTGAILTVNPGLAFTAGAAGAFSESLYTGIFDDDKELTLTGLATDTLIGGATGKLGGSLGKKGASSVKSSLLRGGANQAKRRAVNGWGQILKVSAREEAKYAAKKIASKAGGILAKSAGVSLKDRVLSDFFSSPGGGAEGGPPPDQMPPGNTTTALRAFNEPQDGISGQYGAAVHWAAYVDALRMAGRPAPVHPNQTLDNF